MTDTFRSADAVNPKILVAVILGNTIAWADFALYATFSPILSKVFFPFVSYQSSLLLYFANFAVGFVFRPLGALISGAFADRHGRKNTLLVTVIVSSICTTSRRSAQQPLASCRATIPWA